MFFKPQWKLFAGTCLLLLLASQGAAQTSPEGGRCAIVRYGPGQFTGVTERYACPYDDPLAHPDLGRAAIASGVDATAVGVRARATGDRSTALGHAGVASGDDSVAVGVDAVGAASRSTAIGVGASVQDNATGSVALGAGSVATQANTVSVGAAGAERRITNVAAGTSATDAVNVAQLNALAQTTSQALSAHASSIETLVTLSADQQDQINSLLETGGEDRRDARQGIAAAVAMGSAPMPSAPGRTSYVLNAATFRGEQAVGGSIMHRIKTSEPMAITAGFSYTGNKNNAARVGVAGEF